MEFKDILVLDEDLIEAIEEALEDYVESESWMN
jgi:hypothetical protein